MCIGGVADDKKIEDTVDKHLYDAMHQRLQTPYAKKMKKRRQSTVEPVLGTLINFMGVRRIWTRGIKGAGKFMIAAAIAYNLKKWLNYKQTKAKTAVMAMKKPLQAAFSMILTIQYYLQHYIIKKQFCIEH